MRVMIFTRSGVFRFCISGSWLFDQLTYNWSCSPISSSQASTSLTKRATVTLPVMPMPLGPWCSQSAGASTISSSTAASLRTQQVAADQQWYSSSRAAGRTDALVMQESGSMKIVFGLHHRVEAVMKPLEISAVSQGSFVIPPACDQHTPPPLRNCTLRRLSLGLNMPASPFCVVGGMYMYGSSDCLCMAVVSFSISLPEAVRFILDTIFALLGREALRIQAGNVCAGFHDCSAEVDCLPTPLKGAYVWRV